MSKKRSLTDKVLAFGIVEDIIQEQALNLTNGHYRTDVYSRDVSEVLKDYARKAVQLAIKDGGTRPDFRRRGWKQHFADDTSTTMIKNGLKSLVDKTKKTMATRFPNKVGAQADELYSYIKIASCSGQVAQLILNGLSPKLLQLNEEEGNEYVANVARMMRRAGVPSMIVPI